jgi:hypothetical protein
LLHRMTGLGQRRKWPGDHVVTANCSKAVMQSASTLAVRDHRTRLYDKACSRSKYRTTTGEIL